MLRKPYELKFLTDNVPVSGLLRQLKNRNKSFSSDQFCELDQPNSLQMTTFLIKS